MLTIVTTIITKERVRKKEGGRGEGVGERESEEGKE